MRGEALAFGRRTWVWVAFGVTAAVVACNLNPQPLPPDEIDAATNAGTDGTSGLDAGSGGGGGCCPHGGGEGSAGSSGASGSGGAGGSGGSSDAGGHDSGLPDTGATRFDGGDASHEAAADAPEEAPEDAPGDAGSLEDGASD